ncbi:hypothetical protein UFOVP73_28 [uncultured Caudovirales phage]|uniref:Uncharacterized protein n=1 Tax=uncultured Caudovirales phage TaxID=2100421 RepID=A0A6J7WCJ8_9CAUD|nr:hypothetical protein UFOVP73_28 [uncultured Caudovirales phage]CAB5195128.1 hypothetical protein UFOVP170_50 [uncultured Caudovirales phage]
MDFKTFFFGMSTPERDAFAQSAGTSRGVLTQVAYGNKSIELGFADVICALSGQSVGLEVLPLTANAKRQLAIRRGWNSSPQAPNVRPKARAKVDAAQKRSAQP